MNTETFVIDIKSAEAFQQQVIEESSRRVVVVDFWAEWCQPCQILVPLLTDIAHQYQGSILLAKVNSDENQQLAMQMGIKSLPTVMIFKEGKVVDSFMGVQSESDIKAMIDKHVDNPAKQGLEQARQLLANKQPQQALELLKALNQQYPENTDILIAIAQAYLDNDDHRLCQELLDALPDKLKEDETLRNIRSQLELAASVAQLPDLSEIEKELEKDPENIDLLIKKANLYMARKEYQTAMETLLLAIKKDPGYNDGAARKNLLQIFSILGNADADVRKYRNKLFSLLN